MISRLSGTTCALSSFRDARHSPFGGSRERRRGPGRARPHGRRDHGEARRQAAARDHRDERGLVFAGQLLPRLPFELELGYVHVRRYGHETSGGELVWIAGPHDSVTGRSVLLLDDILDEGHTLVSIRARLFELGAREVLLAALAVKERAQARGRDGGLRGSRRAGPLRVRLRDGYRGKLAEPAVDPRTRGNDGLSGISRRRRAARSSPFPGPPQQHEQENREADADRERAHHVPRIGVPAHETQHGRHQAQDDHEKDEQYQPLRARHGCPPSIALPEYIPVLNLQPIPLRTAAGPDPPGGGGHRPLRRARQLAARPGRRKARAREPISRPAGPASTGNSCRPTRPATSA